jgi:hypothetical protein
MPVLILQRVVGVRRWKKRWCVLEGKLLLYFKTQLEYSHHLSPCSGSVNMGLVLSITPRGPCQLQIVTRSQIIIFVSFFISIYMILLKRSILRQIKFLKTTLRFDTT